MLTKTEKHKRLIALEGIIKQHAKALATYKNERDAIVADLTAENPESSRNKWKRGLRLTDEGLRELARMVEARYPVRRISERLSISQPVARQRKREYLEGRWRDAQANRLSNAAAPSASGEAAYTPFVALDGSGWRHCAICRGGMEVVGPDGKSTGVLCTAVDCTNGWVIPEEPISVPPLPSKSETPL